MSKSMELISRRILLMGAALCCWVSTPAAAAQINYTVDATLSLGYGTDRLGLSGKHYTSVYSIDEASVPRSYVYGSNNTPTKYQIISDFPGPIELLLTLDGQDVRGSIHQIDADTEIGFSYLPSLYIDSTYNSLGAFRGDFIELNGITISFSDHDFYGSGAVQSPPIFSNKDVSRAIGGGLFLSTANSFNADDNVTYYAFSNAVYSGSVEHADISVPEPSSIGLIGLGLAGLLLRNHSRHKKLAIS